jgi:hypothetical protein
MGFCLGNAMKYIWRADLKRDAIEDLRKARWYLDREIERREPEKCETDRREIDARTKKRPVAPHNDAPNTPQQVTEWFR